MSINQSPAWQALLQHQQSIAGTHLREWLNDAVRQQMLFFEHDGILLDCTRQNVSATTLPLLLSLAEQQQVPAQIQAMASGDKINRSEARAALHMALRASGQDHYAVDGNNVVPNVLAVRDQIRRFSDQVRSGQYRGASGKMLRNTIVVGIGGSYLGSEFVAEALATDRDCAAAADKRQLRFLANIDPIDIARATKDIDPAETLVVIISKTFTTAETMLNAQALKRWLVSALGESAVQQHMLAVSSNVVEVQKFGLRVDNIFAMWDWVGGRYSVCSAVGLLPLALQFGFPVVEQFLAGARAIDQHFLRAELRQNLPVILALFAIWNINFLHRPVHALLPYCQALHRFAAHIQQVEMESNGKRVQHSGEPLPIETGAIVFGEPGTNAQHSFYQLIHQGRVVPADFIGFAQSQYDVQSAAALSHHDELMANFFAQPDALALGKTRAELLQENVPTSLLGHKEFPGNRPSNVLLFSRLNPYTCGQLLALYEHRTAVQGFIWQLNSFDQWGVELGKVLAKGIRQSMLQLHEQKAAANPLPLSTQRLLEHYWKQRK